MGLGFGRALAVEVCLSADRGLGLREGTVLRLGVGAAGVVGAVVGAVPIPSMSVVGAAATNRACWSGPEGLRAAPRPAQPITAANTAPTAPMVTLWVRVQRLTR